jgi:hypothetical protein
MAVYKDSEIGMTLHYINCASTTGGYNPVPPVDPVLWCADGI